MADKHDLDFAYVREHADFATVLAHYGIEPIGNVPQLKAHCPFHDDKKPSLEFTYEDSYNWALPLGGEHAEEYLQLLRL